MHLKLPEKGQFKTQQKQLCYLIGNKITDKITKVTTEFTEVHHRIVQKQLKVKQKIKDLIEKYQNKDIYFQKNDSKSFKIM